MSFFRILPLAIGVCISSLTASTMAASLTITPSTVTNDYVGNITLSISNLTTAGETVRVERFLDVNTNGIIDTNDILVESYTVTDGQAFFIGGVRNRNVPGDDDGLTNSTMTVNVLYPGVNDTLNHIAGTYLVRVTDAAGSFTPIIQTLTIVQKNYPQGVHGQVFSAGTGLPLTNTVVVMVIQNGNGGYGTLVDGSGNFTIYSPTNSYGVIPINPAFVADQNSGGVTVTANTFASLSLTNIPATRTISGNISDSSSGIGLPGLFLQAQDTNGLFTIHFTDTNGNYTLGVTAGKWKLKMGSESGPLLGYVRGNGSLNVDTTTANVTNANIQMLKATALVYGHVMDTQSNSVPDLRIQAQDQGNLFDSAGASDASGNYWVGALSSTSLNVSPDNTSLTAAGLIGQGTNFMITDGQAIVQDFILQRVTAHLRGRLIDSFSNALGNFTLVAQPVTTNTSGANSIYPQTGNDGSFDIGVYGGNWSLALESGSAQSANLIGPNLTFSVTNGVDINNITMVAQSGTAQISGSVTDNHGNPLSGVQLFGNTTTNGMMYLTSGTTDTNGFYTMSVFPGTWTVGVNGGDLPARGFQDPPNQLTTITGSTGQTVNFVAQPFSNAPPVLGQISWSGTQFQFYLSGISGRMYRIDVSTNLSTWAPVITNTAFGGGFQFNDPNASAYSRRFYRALLLP